MPPIALRAIGITILGTGALTLAALELTFGFMESGLLGIVLLFTALCAFGALSWGLIRGFRRLAATGALTLVAVLCSHLLSGSIVQAQKRASFERGDSIAASLAEFHSTSSRYPESLSELVPSHLEAVPVTAMGVFRREEFFYSAERPGDGYELSFSAPGWSVCHRTALRSKWACDD